LKSDPVDVLLRQGIAPTNSVVVQANWSDNPWLPDVLNQERLDCLNNEPDEYDHVWEGGYLQATKGAYYARSLSQARLEGRIGFVPADPLMTYRLFVDIGGTGAKADNFVIWVAQFIGREIRVIDHYEVQGQPLSAHLEWMRESGYVPANSKIWLPHDGSTQDKVFDVSYESALGEAGYEVVVIPNQGKGAASTRIEFARRAFPAIWINETKCQAGIDAIGWYQEKWDDKRNVGLGPNHDWASHSADSFGLMCLVYYGERDQEQDDDSEIIIPDAYSAFR
jgi:phage terminase large subunit